MKYDVIIVGSGPAGLFAAHELIGKKVLVLEMGLRPMERKNNLQSKTPAMDGVPYSMAGIGGAGLFSDGKLNFTPIHGKSDLTEFMPQEQAQELVDYVESAFNKYGMDAEAYPTDMKAALRYRDDALKVGIKLQLMKQKHLGSDRLPIYINGMVEELEKKGIVFMTGTKAEGIIVEHNMVKGVRTTKGDFFSDNVIVAPGRIGAGWWHETAKSLGLVIRHQPVEIGVRVEVPREIMDELTRVIYDPVFYVYPRTYEDRVRTFCTNEGGFVTQEDYDGFVCVNGHAYSDRKSENTNFALLSRVNLTRPITDTQSYGYSIGKLATTIGGGKPLLQRYIDLKKGRRSTESRLEKAHLNPTLTNVTPGDIAMALPQRILTNLIEAIELLNKVIPGVASDATLLYAPEIKFYSTRMESDNNLMTSIGGLYIAGDGAGVSGNIVAAAATGIIAARGILHK